MPPAIAPLKLPCLALLPCLAFLSAGFIFPCRATAQVIPDGTLGPESSQLIDVSAIEQLVQGGAQRQENLFHSFEQFSIDEGNQVYFASPADVARIFSRVTGQRPSDIYGTLGVDGRADLFLLNPSGIVFGPNARLDVAGSFTASTADSFVFADGSEFSATVPETLLLTINVPLGVQFNTQPQGNIDSFGQLAAGQDLNLQGRELYVEGGLAAGDTLTLQAQETVTVRDTATTPFVARSGGDLTIRGNQGIDIWTLQPLAPTPFVSGGDLTLISDGAISGDAHFESGGHLQFLTLAGTPGNFVSDYDPIISANGDVLFGDYTGVALKVEATGSIAVGNIVITGPDTTLVADGSGSDEDLLASSRAAILRAGVALENAPNVPRAEEGTAFINIPFAGIPTGSIVVNSINTSDVAGGAGGPIILEAEGSVITTGSFENQLGLPVTLGTSSYADNGASSDAGAISISSLGNVIIEGNLNSFSLSRFGSEEGGNGGAISVSSSENVIIEGSLNSSSWSSSGESGNGGAISVSSPGNVIIEGNLSSSSTVRGAGRSGIGRSGGGGAITVASDFGDVIIEGSLYSPSISTTISDSVSENGGAITVRSNSGDISVAGSLSSFSRSTGISSESGDGGAITVRSNSGDISISRNASPVDSLDSTATSRSESGDSIGGAGGAVTITSLSGNVEIESDLNTFSNSSSSSAEVNSGNGGAIRVASNTRDVTIVGRLNSSSFSLSEFATITGGRGGDITVTALGDIALEGQLDSYSSLDVFSGAIDGGDGGNITINSSSGDIEITGRLDSSTNSGVTSLSEPERIRSGNGGIISVTSDSGNIQTSGEIRSFSLSRSGSAGSGGEAILSAPEGSISSDDTRILTLSVAQAGTAEAAGRVEIEALNSVSGLEILTLSSGGASGNVDIQTYGNSSTFDNLGLITSGQVEIPDPDNPDRIITLNLDDFGQAGNTLIESSGDIVLENVEIQADANGTQPAGGVTITSPGQVTFTNSEINSNANNAGDAGEIRIDVRRLEIGNGGRIFATTASEGNGGSVIINATDAIFLGEGVQDFEPVISVEASGAGRPGNIVINTPSFVLSETARITATATETATNPEGGGSISLNADQMNLAGIVGIFAETQGQAPGGVLTLQPYRRNPDLDLTLASGARVSASTSGSGNGGGLSILAPEAISISGPGLLAVETSGSGRGGDIGVASQQLRLADGVTLSASTDGPGLAGDIIFDISDSFEINGSTVTSSTGDNSTGPGGNIAANAPVTTLSNGGRIEVNSQGTGQGGRVAVTGDQLILADNSRISATTLSSDGGDLTFDLQDLLVLREGSEISTTAGTAEAGGDGGDVTVDAQFIVAVPSENSDITANAFDGNGGNVDITATGGIFGIAPRPRTTPLSDITASSENGVSGSITVQSPDVDPNQGTVELPVDPITSDVAQSCREAYVQTGSEFVVTGRGGLPQGPLDSMATTLWQDALPIENGGPISPDGVNAPDVDEQEFGEQEAGGEASIPTPIVEIQGWIQNEQGEIELVAADPQSVVVGQPVVCQG